MIDQGTNLNSFFKDIYGDRLEILQPNYAVLQNIIPFTKSEADLGGDYVQAVAVSGSQGFTKGGSTANAYTLNSSIGLVTQGAKIRGSQITFTEDMPYGVATRASSTKKAFLEATELIVGSLYRLTKSLTEIDLLYGRSGVGKVASSANQSTTTTLLTIKLSEWAIGIWAGSENCRIQFFQSDGTTLISSGTDSIFTVTRVNNVPASSSVGGTVLITGTTSGIGTLDTYIASNPNVTNIYFMPNSDTTNEMIGLHTISGNTSGTIFNISASQYALWAANTYNAAGTLTFPKLQDAVSILSARGLDEDVMVLVNNRTWGNLATDSAAMRMQDDSYSSTQVNLGTQSIKYFSASGLMEIKSHLCVKEGYAYIFPKKRMMRIGSTDVTFRNPVRNNEFFLERQDINAFQLRAFSDQALFTKTPAKLMRIEQIVN